MKISKNEKRVSDNISYLLAQRSLRRVDLAKGVNVSRATIQTRLKSPESFRLSEIIKIANYFDVELNKIVKKKLGAKK